MNLLQRTHCVLLLLKLIHGQENNALIEKNQEDACFYSDWIDWGQCTTQCGGGFQIRHRYLLNAENNMTVCKGALSQNRTCGNSRCARDCLVSAWGVWDKCDCQQYQQQRTRVILQKEADGGYPCPHIMEIRKCMAKCPLDCLVSYWNTWSACSTTCGPAISERTRSVSVPPANDGEPCPHLKEEKFCDSKPCARNGTRCINMEDGDYPDPKTQCSNLYMSCVANNEVWFRCPDLLKFDPKASRCLHGNEIGECLALSSSAASHRLSMQSRYASFGALLCIGFTLVAFLVRISLWYD